MAALVTLETFHQRVSRAIRRGKVFDGDIPGYAKDAVRSLEDLENWRHMWVEEFSQTLPSGTNTITLERVKSVRYVRFHVSNVNFYRYLKKVSADQVAYIGTETAPVGYWMRSRDVVGLDASPGEALTYDIGYYQYSEYDDDLPWLDIAESLLAAQTIVEMSPLLRDDKVKARWEAVVASRMVTLSESDLVHEFDGQEQRMIPYADEIDDWLLTGAGTD